MTAHFGVTAADLEPAWACPTCVRRPSPTLTDPRIPFTRRSPEQEALAYHEAGHAVVAQAEGVEVFYATVVPRYDCEGHVRHASGNITLPQAVLITLAGPAAQRRHFPLLEIFEADLEDDMGRFDTEQARTLLRVLLGSDHISRDLITLELARWRARADHAVTLRWSWITAVARALEQRQRLSGDEVAHLNPAKRRTDGYDARTSTRPTGGGARPLHRAAAPTD